MPVVTMKLTDADLRPDRDDQVIRVRIPRANRAWLQFHLEAMDGVAYLEDSGQPDIGLLVVPPGMETHLGAWLSAAAKELDMAPIDPLPGWE